MKRNIFLIICLAVSLTCQTNLFAKVKSDKIKPQWVTRTVPESISGTYVFVRAHGEGNSLATAKQVAFSELVHKLEVERKVTISTDLTIQERLEMNAEGTSSSYKQEAIMQVSESGRQYQVVCREIDEYYEAGGGIYRVDVLYTVADKNGYRGSYDDKITVTSKYGAAGFLSIVPGAGQIYKGSVAKGSLIIAGEVAALAGVLLCEETRSSYVKKMYEQPKYAVEYNTLADKWETGRNVCIGAAAAIYVVNLIDAFVSKGAKRVVVKNKWANVRAVPYYDSRSVGMGLTMNF
jgi:hypothetical protein